jgi:hypothetical protein
MGKSYFAILISLACACGGAVAGVDANKTDAGETPPSMPVSSPISGPSSGPAPEDAGEEGDAVAEATAVVDPCRTPADGWTIDACGISGAPTTWTALAACSYRGTGCVVVGDALCCPEGP